MADVIETLTAFVADDKPGEGVVTYLAATGLWIPLVAADEDRVASFTQIAQGVADATGTSIKVLRFSVRTQIGTIEPQAAAHD